MVMMSYSVFLIMWLYYFIIKFKYDYGIIATGNMRNYRVHFPRVATAGSEAGEQAASLPDPASPRSSARLFPSPPGGRFSPSEQGTWERVVHVELYGGKGPLTRGRSYRCGWSSWFKQVT